MKIAVFGGTFDPIHLGHTGLAESVIKNNYADRIIFVPAFIPPHKTEQPVTPFEIRYNLLKIALKGHPGFLLDDLEQKRPGKSYIIDTLRELSAKYPDDRILLLIGSDSLAMLHTWYKAKELVDEFPCLIYPRGDTLSERMELRKYWSEKDAEKLLNSVMPDVPRFPFSSTAIRELLAGNAPETAKMLDPDVLRFILENGCYNTKNNLEKKMSEKEPAEKKKPVTALEIAELSEKVAYERKAENLIRLDMTGLSTESDQYVICTGLSEPHLKAIAERIEREVRTELGVRPLAVDGTPQSRWMIVDYGSVMIHILTEDARAKYQLESLWGDAPKHDIAEILDKEAKKRLASKKTKSK